MSRIPGFTAECTLGGHLGRYHFQAGVATLSGTVEPTFYISPFALHDDLTEGLEGLCRLNCLLKGCQWKCYGGLGCRCWKVVGEPLPHPVRC
jgi:hypothetical protein